MSQATDAKCLSSNYFESLKTKTTMKRNYTTPCCQSFHIESQSMIAASSISFADENTRISDEGQYLSNRRQSIWNNDGANENRSPW